MKMHLSLVLIVLLIGLNAFGQQFTGWVLDSSNRQPIPYSNIYLVEHQTGTITDSLGNFALPTNVRLSKNP